MTASDCNAYARADIPVLFLTVIYTLFVFWLLLYSCPVGGSSNYKLGRLDKRIFGQINKRNKWNTKSHILVPLCCTKIDEISGKILKIAFDKKKSQIEWKCYIIISFRSNHFYDVSFFLSILYTNFKSIFAVMPYLCLVRCYLFAYFAVPLETQFGLFK